MSGSKGLARELRVDQSEVRMLNAVIFDIDGILIDSVDLHAEAAGKAGIRTIGLLCGGWSETKLREAGCIAIYHDPADLLRQYDTSPLARR
jgi:phosphoglycolate phosphatase-like HAD superfamily hydrolase